MARVTGPLLSMNATGTIAKTQTYSKWRGIAYVRQHVVPGNPRTAAQTATRSLFALLNKLWLNAPAEVREPWTAFTAGRPLMNRNAFIGQNITANRGQINMNLFVGSPGAKGGLPPASIDAVGVAGGVTVTLIAPPIPDGWAIQSAVATVIQQQAPDDEFAGVYRAGTDVATPYAITITGLAAGIPHVVTGWFVWTKPDGSLAYSPSLSDVATPV